MEVNALVESVKFMFLGMGVVFAFLTIMVYAIKIQAVLIQKLFPVKESSVVKKEQPKPVQENIEKKIAAITAAVEYHTSNTDVRVTTTVATTPVATVENAVVSPTAVCTPVCNASSVAVGATVSGTIWKIAVKVGDSVQKGDVIAIIEAMKMEIDVEASASGTISSIAVTQNQAVEEGQTIAVIS